MGLLDAFESPLFLGGAGLLAGEGFSGALQGMKTGYGLQDARKKQALEDERRRQFESLLGSTQGIDPSVVGIARAAGPEQGLDLLAKYADPMRGLQMKKAQVDLKNAESDLALSPLKAQEIRARIEQGRNGKYGLQPIYGRDANGNPIIMQLGPNGEAVQTKIPGGAQVDLGMKSYEQASGKERGGATAKAQVSLPRAEYNARKMTTLLDGVLNDPYLPNMVGPVQGRFMNLSGASNRIQGKLDQIQGQTFLQAFEALKGAGQITEIEGQKATESLNRLGNMKPGTEDYVSALREFRQDVADLLEIARAKARGDFGQPAQQTQPAAPGSRKSLDLGDGFTLEVD